jgi:hypothetical protein
MRQLIPITVITALLFASPLFAQENSQTTPLNKKDQKESWDKLKKDETASEEDKKQHYDYLSLAYAKKENNAITVVNHWEVEFRDTTFQQFQFHKSYDRFAMGLGVDFSSDSKEAMRISGLFGIDDYIIMVEQAKISGKITKDGVSQTLGKFDDNQYLDIKFTKQKKTGATGAQYFSYERPTVLKENNVVYYDPKAKLTFIAIGIELDNVKKKMLAGENLPVWDWYFYNTTFFGYGSLELSDQARNENHALAKPSTTSWGGLGMTGEYELGLVFSGKIWGMQAVSKIGYNYQIEGPIMFTSDSLDVGGGNVEPTEQFINHGINLTIAMSF